MFSFKGGHFDLPDRMFHSVRDTWISASRHNMADVRELIPEFFYLPDFLINSNHFEMGIKQNGVEVNNVVLPPWAKSDPREFIRVHREVSIYKLTCLCLSTYIHFSFHILTCLSVICILMIFFYTLIYL